MPILLLGNKIRQFKQLAVLQQCRLNRFSDPLSAYQREDHRTALQLVSDILKQEWSFLLIERRFLRDTRTYTEYLTKAQVADKLLAALEAYEKCLTHQAAQPAFVRYDLAEFERNLAAAVSTVYTIGQTVLYEAIERPRTSWKCTKEYEGWKGSWRDMMDPLKGKLRVRETDVPELGRLIDGNITVTFCDENGEGVEDFPLVDTLPEGLVDTFDEAFKHAGSAELKMEPQVVKAEAAGSPMIPQGRREFTFRPKSMNKFDAIKIEGDGDILTPVVLETRPSVRLTLRRKRVDKAME